MRNLIVMTVLGTQLILMGCAGVGTIATSNPDVKLNDAFHLYRFQNRPIPAERLIREAMEIYQTRNDLNGLGSSNLWYGDLILASVETKNGFLDSSITSDNRVAKSKEYTAKALEHFYAAVEQNKETSKFDELTNLYLKMAWASNMKGDRKKACEFYDKAFVAYNKNIRLNPTAKPYGSVPDFLTAENKRLRCE